MNGHPTKSALCALCGQTFPPDELVPAEVIRPRLARLIRHEKLDHLLRKQSQRLFEIQQIQLDLMRDLAGVLPRSNHAPAPQNPTPAHPK